MRFATHFLLSPDISFHLGVLSMVTGFHPLLGRKFNGLALLLGALFVASQCQAATVHPLISESAPKGGLLVQLGGESGEHTAALSNDGQLLVHRLDNNAERVDEARRYLRANGLYGQVSVQRWLSDQLPYSDNLVNLVVADDAMGIPREEIMRVLSPGGYLLVKNGRRYEKIRKPRPEEMDEWTHQWHGANGNMFSNDKALGVPNGVQWVAGPLFPVDGRKSSARGMLLAGGRVFYITQNHQENLVWDKKERPNHLIARNAFNGLPLWQMPWTPPTPDGSAFECVVVDGDRLYGVNGEDFIAIDATNGETLHSFETPEKPRKVLYSDGHLIVEAEKSTSAYDPQTGEQKWHTELANPYGTVVDDNRAFCIVGSRQDSGKWLHEIVCLDLTTGKEQWRRPTESEHSRGKDIPRLAIQFAADGLLCLVDNGLLQALSTDDGSEVWRKKTDGFGRSGWDTRFVGHFYGQGLIWMRRYNAEKTRRGQELWQGLDPETGEVKKQIKSRGSWPESAAQAKIGCQPLMATEKYIIFSRQATYLDAETGIKDTFKFARGGCTVGMIPANGLAYTAPHACGCFTEAVRGFMSMTSRSTLGLNYLLLDDEEIFEKGPAYGAKMLPARSQYHDEWTSFRSSSTRSSHALTVVPDDLEQSWSTTVANAKPTSSNAEWKLRMGPTISAPVIAEGKLFVADPIGHRIAAMDAKSGKPVWEFIAGGRIDSPPTIHRGLCLFGSHDGSIYCVNAETGKLVWRRLAAPSDRRIVAFGQVASVWPVAGSVLVHNDTAFAVAGRGPDADGGLFVYAIEPESGDVLWTKNITDGFGLSDIMVSDGQNVYVANQQIDPETGEVEEQFRPFEYFYWPRNWNYLEPDENTRTSYLASGKVSMLESTWTTLPLALRKNIHDLSYQGVHAQLLAFSPNSIFGYQVSLDRETRVHKAMLFGRGPSEVWSEEVPMTTRLLGLASTENALFAVGVAKREVEEEKKDGDKDKKKEEKSKKIEHHNILWTIPPFEGVDPGKYKDFEIELPAAPVYNGVAAAGGRLYVCTEDGNVVCYEGK